MTQVSPTERALLVEMVRRLMTGGYGTEAEDDRALDELKLRVPHPAWSGLIFYSDEYFDHEPTADEIVNQALSYRAIEL